MRRVIRTLITNLKRRERASIFFLPKILRKFVEIEKNPRNPDQPSFFDFELWFERYQGS
jgi:hypothetical protein